MKLTPWCSFIASFLLITISAFADDLTPQAHLRKLSLHLRGLTPELFEYTELEIAIVTHKDSVFFQNKTREYLESPQHVAKMMTRLDELFRVKITADPPELLSDPNSMRFSDDQDIMRNSLDSLFREIVRENLSWDSLLTRKKYTLFNQRSLTEGYEFGVYDSIFSDLPEPPGSEGLERQADPDDPRLAGAITTKRFLHRYQNSNINMNRRRAAAVFRIFLCDDMRPAAVTSNQEIEELLDLSFPRPKGKVASHPQSFEKRHASDPACMACHFKLEPMGSAFEAIGSTLFEEPSRGALVFDRADGTRVNIRGRGLGDIATSITHQPEYSQCQVRTFWNWFIGKDVPLSPARLKTLSEKFDDDRRPNNFINYLVNQPEFTSRGEAPSPQAAAFLTARPHLAACTSCHVSPTGGAKDFEVPPSFNRFPIGGTSQTHLIWLNKIAKSLDFNHSRGRATMPPAEAT